MLKFTENTRIQLGDNVGKILVMKEDVVMIKFNDGHFCNMSPQKLIEDYHCGALTLLADDRVCEIIPILSDEEQKQLDRMNAYLLELDQQEYPGSINTRRAVIEKIGKQLEEPAHYRPSPSTLHRWYKLWLDAGKHTVRLLNLKRVPKKRKGRIDAEIINLINETIDDVYLSKQAVSVIYAYKVFKKKFREMGYAGPCPAQSTFYNFFKGLDPVDVIRCRQGTAAARKFARTACNIFFAEYVLERVEIDAIQPNIGIIDHNNNYIGTPIIYFAIDCHSRAIVGYAISYGGGGETSTAVIECLKHSIIPKPRSSYPYTQNEWTMHGLPCEVICDAGTAFTSNVVSSFLASAGITRVTTETKQPWLKGLIERFNKTFQMQCLLALPGFVGKRKDARELDVDMKKAACLCPDEFEQVLVEYIVDEYHQQPHRGIGLKTPAQAWEEGTRFNRPSMSNIETLSAFSGVEVTSTIQAHKGIEHKTLRYNSHELSQLHLKLKQNQGNSKKNIKASYIFNSFDISRVLVTDPFTAEILFVPCVDKSIQAGTNLAEYKAKRKARMSSAQELVPPITHGHPVIEQAKARSKVFQQQDKKVKAEPSALPAVALSTSDLDEMLNNKQQMHAEPRKSPSVSKQGSTSMPNDTDFTPEGFDVE